MVDYGLTRESDSAVLGNEQCAAARKGRSMHNSSHTLCFACTLVVATLLPSQVRAQGGDFRMVASPRPGCQPVPRNFLKRVNNAGYTHIVVNMSLALEYTADWANGEYRWFTDAGAPHAYYDALIECFVSFYNWTADNNAPLTMVPMIQSGSKWSGHFKYANNPNMCWEKVYKQNVAGQLTNQARDKNALIRAATDEEPEEVELPPDTDPLSRDHPRQYYMCPCFGEDPDGYDKTFRNMLGVIVEAFAAARRDSRLHDPTRFPARLEFFHVGHDEPLAMDLNPVAYDRQLFVAQSDLDRQWLNDTIPENAQGALGRILLMATELQRRIDDVHQATDRSGQVAPFAQARVIAHSDAWDPQMEGSYFWRTDRNYYPLQHASELVTDTYKPFLIMMTNQYDYTHVSMAKITPTVNSAYTWNGEPYSATFSCNLDIDTRGHLYDAAATFSHFRSAGLDYMYKWWVGSAEESFERWTQMFQLIDRSKEAGAGFLGYCAPFYPRGDQPQWDETAPTYDQPYYYNGIELLASGAHGAHLARPGQIGSANSTFFGFMRVVPSATMNSVVVPTFLADISPVTCLDYFLVNRNVFNADVAAVDHAKLASFHDAILYCNNLSEREGMEKVYTYGAGDAWFYDKVLNPQDLLWWLGFLRMNPLSNGYRLPTAEEMAIAQSEGVLAPNANSEWVWVSDAGDATAPSRYDADGVAYEYQGSLPATPVRIVVGKNGPTVRRTFRVCRNGAAAAPKAVAVSGTGSDAPTQAISQETITFSNARLTSGTRGLYISGREVRILPETVFPWGSSVQCTIDPALK